MEHKEEHEGEQQEHQENKVEQGDIEIVAPTPEDSEAIGKVLKEAWRQMCSQEDSEISEEDIEDEIRGFDSGEALERRLKRIEHEDPKENIWIAKVDGYVVGVCSVGKKKDGYRINALYVLPEYQGRGVGSKLMEQALDWLGRDNTVYLNVAAYNSKAIDFYRKLGFSVTDNIPHSERARLKSGKEIKEVEMMREGSSM